MNHLHATRTLNYTVQELYNMVLDIESYPEFLSWISHINIISKSQDSIIADVMVNFKSIRSSYRSHVQFSFLGNTAFVKVHSSHGPLKHLVSIWNFTQDKESTFVECSIEFELRSTILNGIAKSYMAPIAEEIVTAFENRALEI